MSKDRSLPEDINRYSRLVNVQSPTSALYLSRRPDFGAENDNAEVEVDVTEPARGPEEVYY